ncbi:MAG: DUF4340 domain-containing protein [Alphaproteobacteria bacterium]|nr:DUF4340 domain-containing protein [Alphaproteobacteria bacterium]
MTAPATPIVPVLKRRLRSLTYLAGATGLAVILAAVAVWQLASTGEPEFKPERMFPALEAKANDITSIQIETKKASFNISRTANGVWRLPDKANYPADFNTLRKVILGLSELDLVERRTARTDWHDRLGLGLPKTGGSGTLVTLKDAKGEVLASLIAGASVEGASAGGRKAIYVRRLNQDQTFVARGDFSAPAELTQWLDKAFVDLARDRVQKAAIKPLKGRAYTVTRATPQDANFRVVDSIPAGRTLRTETEANGVGNALLGLSFDDVVPQTTLDFTTAARAEFVSFDGLTLSLSLIEKGQDFWMTVNAVGVPVAQTPPASPSAPRLKPDVVKEAKEINGVVAGWAYKIPRYKGVLLSSPLEDLLKPVGSPPGQ